MSFGAPGVAWRMLEKDLGRADALEIECSSILRQCRGR